MTLSDTERPTSTTSWPASLVDLERHELGLAVYSDPDIYRRELRQLFPRLWNFVAHTSEIPSPGSYVTRYIGADPVIVARTREGAVSVSLNVCAHKGARLCRADDGQNERFMCPYHGWTFGLDGTFIGAPFETREYGNSPLDRAEVSLKRARVEELAGLVFATWDEDVPPLTEYFGSYAKVLKLALERTDSGLEVIGPPVRWVVDTNWKNPCEQLYADAYHLATTHRTLFERLSEAAGAPLMETTVAVLEGTEMVINGHEARMDQLEAAYKPDGEQSLTPEDTLRHTPPTGLPPSMIEEYLARAPRDQIEMMATKQPAVMLVFPNLCIFTVPVPDPRGRGMLGIQDIRLFRPLGPTRTEMWHWLLMERDAPEEWRTMVSEGQAFFHGPSGATEQEDFEVWSRVTRGAEAPLGQQSVARYPAQEDPGADERFPGAQVWEGFPKDGANWRYWMRWRDVMSREL